MWSTLLLACAAPTAPLGEPFLGVSSVEAGDASLIARWAPAEGADGYRVEAVGPGGPRALDLGPQADRARLDALAEGVWAVTVFARRGPLNDPGHGPLEQRVGDRLEALAYVPVAGLADVWGDGDIVVAAGHLSGHSALLFDVADPTAPRQLHTLSDVGFVKDVKLGDGLLFLQGECGCPDDPEAREAWDQIGVRTFDITDPAEPVLLAEVGPPHQSIHNLAYADGVLYLSDNVGDAMPILDVSVPDDPRWLHTWRPPEGIVHDQAVVGDRVYVAWWRGFSVLDVSDPSAPRTLVEHQDPELRAVHNVWPTEDGRHVLVTSERLGGHLTIYDISDPARVRQVAALDPFPDAVIHNVHVRGDLAFVAWYSEGLVVIDLQDPSAPRVLGQLHTPSLGELPVPPEQAVMPYRGAWGVWPYGPDGLIAVTDMQQGLFLAKLWPERVER